MSIQGEISWDVVTLARENSWFGWAMPLGEGGTFRFDGVPDGGPYRLTVCAQGVILSLENAAASPTYPAALRAMVTRDHTDLEVLVLPQTADREELQPRDKPMRGVEGERAQ